MNKGVKILKMTVIGVTCVLLFGYVTMLLWNWLIPSVFSNGREINFVQALGLLLLSKILFSGFGGKRWSHQGSMQWKRRYYDKLAGMTPEERERFKSRMKEKWCSPAASTTVEKNDTSNV
jgi:hypothetical protein